MDGGVGREGVAMDPAKVWEEIDADETNDYSGCNY